LKVVQEREHGSDSSLREASFRNVVLILPQEKRRSRNVVVLRDMRRMIRFVFP
jgi:type IV secretory pathway VirB9-like protein